jgi:hypothetical protein
VIINKNGEVVTEKIVDRAVLKFNYIDYLEYTHNELTYENFDFLQNMNVIIFQQLMKFG